MNRRDSRASRRFGAVEVIVFGVSVLVAGVLSVAAARGQDARPGHTDHHHGDASDETQGHIHAPVPPEYKSAHLPASAWTNPRLIARGKQIHTERCAVCHGDSGDGKGPAGMALPLKPPDLRDARMVGEMTGNYWFWRVSEGGAVEPFKSAGSVMPAWKHELSVQDRWAVIVYQHTFSGHEGPHVTSEHPESVMGSHTEHGTSAKAGGTPPASSTPTGLPAGGHRH